MNLNWTHSSRSVNHTTLLHFHRCSNDVCIIGSCWSDLEVTWQNATCMSLQVWVTDQPRVQALLKYAVCTWNQSQANKSSSFWKAYLTYWSVLKLNCPGVEIKSDLSRDETSSFLMECRHPPKHTRLFVRSEEMKTSSITGAVKAKSQGWDLRYFSVLWCLKTQVAITKSFNYVKVGAWGCTEAQVKTKGEGCLETGAIFCPWLTWAPVLPDLLQFPGKS